MLTMMPRVLQHWHLASETVTGLTGKVGAVQIQPLCDWVTGHAKATQKSCDLLKFPFQAGVLSTTNIDEYLEE